MVIRKPPARDPYHRGRGAKAVASKGTYHWTGDLGDGQPEIDDGFCHLMLSGIPRTVPCLELLKDSPKASVPCVFR